MSMNAIIVTKMTARVKNHNRTQIVIYDAEKVESKQFYVLGVSKFASPCFLLK